MNDMNQLTVRFACYHKIVLTCSVWNIAKYEVMEYDVILQFILYFLILFDY